MIDYTRLNDKDYVNRTLQDIASCQDQRDLSDILKEVSYKLHYKSISPEEATLISNTVKERLKSLTNSRGANSNEKILRFSPTSSYNTSISNKAGTVSIIFLVVNAAIIASMYTLLVISHLIK